MNQVIGLASQNNFNQLLTNSRLLTFNTAQQIDTKLIAFLTILTVAFSIILSFKQSRCYIINATKTYPPIRKCITCLKEVTTTCSSSNTYTRLLFSRKSSGKSTRGYYYSKYLKLKRLTSTLAKNLTSSTFSRVNKYYWSFKKASASSQSCSVAGGSSKRLSRCRPTLTNSKNLASASTPHFDYLLEKCSSCITRQSFKIERNLQSTTINNNNEIATEFRRTTFHLDQNQNDLIELHEDDDDEDEETSFEHTKTQNYFSPAIIPLFRFCCDEFIRTSSFFGRVFNYYEFFVEKLTKRTKKFPLKKSFNSRVRLYKKLPLRSMSRAWGKLNSIDLPLWFRKPTFYFYSWIFSCNLDEIEIEDLNEYKNLSEFFRRSLKPDARTIDIHSGLISPCDGKVLNFGQVNNGFLEQVKGVNYSLQGFLGNHNWPKNASSLSPSATASFAANLLGVRSTLLYKNLKSDTMSDIQSLQDHYENENMIYEKSILYNPAANRLYHCVIYLAPGDYHRFHSPTDWVIFFRRHFPGELFSVNPSVARWLQGLFNLNERVVYYGQWKYGFFSMAAVGATNVGSIKVFMDDNLTTNNKLNEKNLKNIKKEQNQHFDRSFITDEDNEEQSGGVQMNRGEIFGEFNLGSTIVLIFEAPANFKFNIELNEKVRFGQPLGS